MLKIRRWGSFPLTPANFDSLSNREGVSLGVNNRSFLNRKFITLFIGPRFPQKMRGASPDSKCRHKLTIKPQGFEPDRCQFFHSLKAYLEILDVLFDFGSHLAGNLGIDVLLQLVHSSPQIANLLFHEIGVNFVVRSVDPFLVVVVEFDRVSVQTESHACTFHEC